MKETFSKVEELAGHVKEYLNNRVTSVKLSAAEKSSKLLSQLIAFTIVFIVFIIFIIFAGIALAYFLSKLTGEYYWGFSIVSALFLLLVWITWKAKEKLIRLPIMNAILNQLFKEEETNEKV